MPDTELLMEYLMYGGLLVLAAGHLTLIMAASKHSGGWVVGMLLLPAVDLIFVLQHWNKPTNGNVVKTGAALCLVGFTIIFGAVRYTPEFSGHPYEYLRDIGFGENEVNAINAALTKFHTDHARYPTTEEGLDILLPNTDGKRYLSTDSIPLDPWDTPYQYTSNEDHAYTLFTFSKDRLPGGDGGEADYIIIEKTQPVEQNPAQVTTPEF